MPLRFVKPSAYQRTADNSPVSSSNGGCSRYANVRTSREHCSARDRLSASARRDLASSAALWPVDQVEIHGQRGQTLRCRVVQVEGETPPFFILQLEQPAGQMPILLFAQSGLFRHRVGLRGAGGQPFIRVPQLLHEIVEFRPGLPVFRVGLI